MFKMFSFHTNTRTETFAPPIARNHRSKSKPEVEFQYGGQPFSETIGWSQAIDLHCSIDE